jgi:IS30 family transposase
MNLSALEQTMLELWHAARMNTREIASKLTMHEADVQRLLRDIWDRQYVLANAKEQRWIG